MFKEANKYTTNTKPDQSHHLRQNVNDNLFIPPKVNIDKNEDMPVMDSGQVAKNVNTTKHTFFNQAPGIQKESEEENKKEDVWHTDTFIGNHHMPYEIQIIFQNIDKDVKYEIPQEHKDIFNEWKKILIKNRWSLQGDPDADKARILNNFNLIIGDINSGTIVKERMQIIKEKDIAFQAASDWNEDAEKSCNPISEADLITIFKEGDLFKQLETNNQGRKCKMIENNQCLKDKDEYIKFLKDKKIVDRINEAFRIMGIDTIKAQAVYLAHAAGESNNLMSLTETKNKWMEKYRGGEKFRGRGAFHTTHKDGYIKVLAYLDALLSNDEIQEKDKEKIKKASEAIKKDVTKASDPEFTFIFSAAYMHMAGGVSKSGNVEGSSSFLGKGPESSWVAGGDITTFKEKKKFEGRAKLKARVYRRAMKVLERKKCDSE